MNVILCGLPASGKTAIGKTLAERLDYCFLDIDDLIEKAYFMSKGQKLACRQIAKQEGIDAFRCLEKQQIHELHTSSNDVIALGGGALCDPLNIKKIKTLGRLVYLKVPVEVIWKRLETRGMPTFLETAFPEQSFYKLAQERIPIYENAAEIIVDTETMDKENIVEMILKKVSDGG